MSVEETQRTITAYFEAMEDGRLAQFLAEDATWTTAQSGAVVNGAPAVQAAIHGLHQRMHDLRPGTMVVADGAVYLEGDCALSAQDADQRIPWCLAYDVQGDRVTAIRAYGQIAAFMP